MSDRDIKLRVWLDAVTTIATQMDQTVMYSHLVKKLSKPLISESESLQILENFYTQLKNITSAVTLQEAIDALTSDAGVEVIKRDVEQPHNGYCIGVKYPCDRCAADKFV